jgi:cytidylate kinase
MNRIITISRQFGSGGRTIGRETAAKLGIPCYDQELIQKIAAESGFTPEYVTDKGEYMPGNFWTSAFSDRDFYGHSVQDDLWLAQKTVIESLAEAGPCVIVGRCADFILREKADCLTAFIHASPEKRAERIVQQYGERDLAPEKRLKDKDKRRAAYYQFYTDMEWGNLRNYQIALDSGALGLELCADLLAELYKKRG